jgi:hypothetical protein
MKAKQIVKLLLLAAQIVEIFTSTNQKRSKP